MNTNRKSYVLAFALIVLAIVLLFSFFRFPEVDAIEIESSPTWFAGSDCIANRATGDFYPNGQNSSHCEQGQSSLTIEDVVVDGDKTTVDDDDDDTSIKEECHVNCDEDKPVDGGDDDGDDDGGDDGDDGSDDGDDDDGVDDGGKNKKQHCDKGEGNGGEDCDPGKNPDKGNNDEDTTNDGPDHDNGNKNTDKENGKDKDKSAEDNNPKNDDNNGQGKK